MSRRVLLLVAALATSPLTPCFAQTTGPDEARVRSADGLTRTRGALVRWDEQTGTPASVSFDRGAPIPAASPALAATLLCEEELAPLFDRGLRVASDLDHAPLVGAALVVRETRDLGRGHARVTLEQVVGRVPVRGARVDIELAASEAGFIPVRVTARYFPGAPLEAPAFAAEVEGQLLARYPGYVAGHVRAATTTARVLDGATFRSAFVVQFMTGSPPESYEALVDGLTGRELARARLSMDAAAQGLAYEKNPMETPRAAKRLAGLYVNQGANRVVTDAQGLHNLAGMVSLDEGLSGPLLRVLIDGEAELTYSGPADINLAPDEAGAHQDEVAAWYHVTSYNAYFGATYPGSSRATSVRLALLTRAKKNGQPFANAFFTPQTVQFYNDTFPGYVAMGTFGGNEASRSSSVVRHEYTHGLLQRLATLSGNLEAAGLNEGLADYFPAAQAEDPRMGVWLVNPAIRDLTRKLVWPQDNTGDPHRVGHIFAGALWQARAAAETRQPGDRLKVDQAVFAGVLRFRGMPSLIDAREAIVAADKAVNGGTNQRLLEQAFFEHGVGPAPTGTNGAPKLAPLADQDAVVGQTLTVKVTATDPDNDPVALSASKLANATFDAKAGTLTFKPDASQVGALRETFTATDGLLTASATITINVKVASAPATPPIVLTPPTLAPTAPPAIVPVSSARPAATASAPSMAVAPGKSGGGGGCALGTEGANPLSLLPYAIAIGSLVVARRRR